MKKLLQSALCFVPLIILIVAVNWLMDPASLFNKEHEKNIATALLAGSNVADVRNIDDRKMIEYYLAQRNEPIKCMVLGASRGMQISQETTGVENTFNTGVTGAELRDMISIYEMYTEKFAPPEQVVLVLEPWTLSRSSFNERGLTQGYESFCTEHDMAPIKVSTFQKEWNKISELFRIGYFQQSINPFWSGDFGLDRTAQITTETISTLDIRKSDGSYVYASDFVPTDTARKAKLLADMKKLVPPIFNSYALDADLQQQLEVFVQTLTADGVKVTFFIPPIIEEYYLFLRDESPYAKVITETLPVYQSIAQTYQVPIIGTYNPSELSLTDLDFYDVLHPTYECVYTLFEPYRVQ